MDSSTVRVRTPEHVELEYKLAGIGSRAIAQLLDLLVLAGAYLALGVLIALWVYFRMLGGATVYLVGGSILLAFFLFWGYFILFEYYMLGQTPGKRVAKIRVIQGDGRNPAFLAILLRNFFRLVDLLPNGYLLGIIVMLTNQQERRIGDLVAGTMVVTAQRNVRPLEWLAPDGTQGEGRAAAVRVVGVKGTEIGLALEKPLPVAWEAFLQSYLQRARNMPASPRNALALQIWDRLLAEQLVEPVFHQPPNSGPPKSVDSTSVPAKYKAQLVIALAKSIRKKGRSTYRLTDEMK